MPKVSQEHSDARRVQILEGARRAFAKYGYEGATVVRLEEATGLSRGAIFHYYADKRDLFVAVAGAVNRELVSAVRESGFAGAIREIVNSDPELLAVLIETDSRLRHDEEFVRRMGALSDELRLERSQWWEEHQASGALRTDIAWPQLASFVAIVMNGLALRVVSGDTEGIDVEAVIRMLEDAVRLQR